MDSEGARITREDLEERLKALAEAINAASEPARRSGFRLSLLVAAAMVVLAYLLGRRQGRTLRGLLEVRGH